MTSMSLNAYDVGYDDITALPPPNIPYNGPSTTNAIYIKDPRNHLELESDAPPLYTAEEEPRIDVGNRNLVPCSVLDCQKDVEINSNSING